MVTQTYTDFADEGVFDRVQQPADVDPLEDRAVGHGVEPVVVFRREVEEQREEFRVLVSPQLADLLLGVGQAVLSSDEVGHAVVHVLDQQSAIGGHLCQREEDRVCRRHQSELRLVHNSRNDLSAEELVPGSEAFQRVEDLRKVDSEETAADEVDDSADAWRQGNACQLADQLGDEDGRVVLLLLKATR